MNGRSSEREFATDSSLEGDGFELFVPLGISASPSWWSRARKPHGAPEGSFSVAGPIVRIHLPPAAESGANSSQPKFDADGANLAMEGPVFVSLTVAVLI